MTTMGITFPHEFWKKPYNHHRCLLGKMWTGSLKAPGMELRKNSIAFGPSYFVLVERMIEISFRFSFTIKTFSWPSLIICECLNLPHKMLACGLLRNCSVERMMWNVGYWDHDVSDERCSPWKECHGCVRRARFWGCASPSKPCGKPVALTAQEWRGRSMSTT